MEFPAEASISKLETGGRTRCLLSCCATSPNASKAAGGRAVPRRNGGRAGGHARHGTVVQHIASPPWPMPVSWTLFSRDGTPLRRVASSWQKKTLTPALDALAALSLDWDSPAAVIDVMRRGHRLLVRVQPVVVHRCRLRNAAAHYIDHRGR